MTDVDVIVVGLGAWGSAALWRLAVRGVHVLGIDAASVPNPYGSSHGHTRLFRVACHEHVGLTPLARRSRDLLHELGDQSGERLLEQTGAISIGPPGGRALGGVTKALAAADIDAVELTVTELRDRFPQHAGLGDHYAGVWDAEAGFVRVESSITAAVREAVRLGAEVWDRTAVITVQPQDAHVAVSTAGQTVTTGQVVLAMGPWMGSMQEVVPLVARRAPLLWWQAAEDPDAFTLERFPAFIRHYDDDHTIWGHGSVGNDIPVKLGLSQDPVSQTPVDPSVLDRGMRPERDWASAAEVVRWAVPGLVAEPLSASPCMITDSPDHQFLIGRHPDSPAVILAGGGSGHGFKHAMAIGELVAQTATDEELFSDVSFLDPRRFRGGGIARTTP